MFHVYLVQAYAIDELSCNMKSWEIKVWFSIFIVIIIDITEAFLFDVANDDLRSAYIVWLCLFND